AIARHRLRRDGRGLVAVVLRRVRVLSAIRHLRALGSLLLARELRALRGFGALLRIGLALRFGLALALLFAGELRLLRRFFLFAPHTFWGELGLVCELALLPAEPALRVLLHRSQQLRAALEPLCSELALARDLGVLRLELGERRSAQCFHQLLAQALV